MSAGRPTLYDPKYCDELIAYFHVELYKEKTVTKINRDGSVSTAPVEVASDFPSIAGFAVKIGVHRDTLHEWGKVHPEFKEVLLRAKDYQENFLVVNGNRGLLQANFAIFTAKNVLNWRDKQPDEEDQVNINITLADRMEKARARAGKK